MQGIAAHVLYSRQSNIGSKHTLQDHQTCGGDTCMQNNAQVLHQPGCCQYLHRRMLDRTVLCTHLLQCRVMCAVHAPILRLQVRWCGQQAPACILQYIQNRAVGYPNMLARYPNTSSQGRNSPVTGKGIPSVAAKQEQHH